MIPNSIKKPNNIFFLLSLLSPVLIELISYENPVYELESFKILKENVPDLVPKNMI